MTIFGNVYCITRFDSLQIFYTVTAEYCNIEMCKYKGEPPFNFPTIVLLLRCNYVELYIKLNRVFYIYTKTGNRLKFNN